MANGTQSESSKKSGTTSRSRAMRAAFGASVAAAAVLGTVATASSAHALTLGVGGGIGITLPRPRSTTPAGSPSRAFRRAGRRPRHPPRSSAADSGVTLTCESSATCGAGFHCDTDLQDLPADPVRSAARAATLTGFLCASSECSDAGHLRPGAPTRASGAQADDAGGPTGGGSGGDDGADSGGGSTGTRFGLQRRQRGRRLFWQRHRVAPAAAPPSRAAARARASAGGSSASASADAGAAAERRGPAATATASPAPCLPGRLVRHRRPLRASPRLRRLRRPAPPQQARGALSYFFGAVIFAQGSSSLARGVNHTRSNGSALAWNSGRSPQAASSCRRPRGCPR